MLTKHNYLELTMNQYKKIDSNQITYKTEELLEVAHNRYKVTIQVANRAKRRKYEDIDIVDDPLMKPIIRSILEMVDEITQPEIIGD
uniref:Putative DNA-directed RNA polymerase subunit omega n=1 Tax=Grateloupia turuturu TaxID=118375 RepID=A0A6B9P3T0_9FLOR|nr:putative DNA-directed RNA polymerase subunit omega [Grateloupia turuturu]QHD45188.1 putative DNA-directed RNA polymerase subunit omega [Grateloupia turuturu]UXC96732.1 putative DNA-directed RNA polymerase subunit omega [Grateloupia turuturu]